ncbi:hypothetical protein AALP_AA7G037500 [Arabis alpina]|uniref:Knottin scorpion toxin-like domain-containing protein n=1 Tax=Arabis alpina TaxID=50452 RepID=A0A087GFR3_ARAAL|nr:hypothetical protein AALP_AA7G037500 [Arabis alpina]
MKYATLLFVYCAFISLILSHGTHAQDIEAQRIACRSQNFPGKCGEDGSNLCRKGG